MKKVSLIFIAFAIVLFSSGCSNKTYTVEIHPKKEKNSIRRVALFLDGTANDFKSRTNISKLYNIIANQDLDNLYLFYNKGVGTDGKFIGAGTGFGIDKDVREAYEFLTLTYSLGSKIYLFGFSRGAYTARILAGMIQTVGIYDLKQLNKYDRKQLIKKLYQAYKGKNKTKEIIQKKANKVIQDYKTSTTIYQTYSANNNDKIIKMMGLWDTVEALGVVSTIEAIKNKLGIEKDKQDITHPNNRYYDKICKVEYVFHALALDDNRANVFTPIIMTDKDMITDCGNDEKNINISKVVTEVWFSGAHADIGGGYDYDDNLSNENELSLSGVSLNWMLKNISKVDRKLIPKNIKVYQDINGKIHNAESSIRPAYKKVNRVDILKKYLQESIYKKIKIHKSVIDRLKLKNRNGYDSKWYEFNSTNTDSQSILLQKCFQINKNILFKEKECKFIEIIE